MRMIRGPKPKKLHIVDCRFCGAAFECCRDELRYESDPRDGDAYVLVCQSCKSETWISAKKFQED